VVRLSTQTLDALWRIGTSRRALLETRGWRVNTANDERVACAQHAREKILRPHSPRQP